MLEVHGLTRTYRSRGGDVPALRDVSFSVRRGELLAVRGRSGSGKTTLLNCVGGIDRPDAGRVVIDGVDVTALDDDGRERLRRDTIGYVFQSFGLLPMLSAAENVGIPLRLRRASPADREERVRVMLRLVGLGDHGDHRPDELSGGQQQRVAIARALAGEPALLLADEPTGQLDSQTGATIMELLHALVRTAGVTAVVTTHDATLLAEADRILDLSDGRLLESGHSAA